MNEQSALAASLHRRLIVIGVAAVLINVVAISTLWQMHTKSADSSVKGNEAAEQANHKPLKYIVDFPGVTEPQLMRLQDVRLPASTSVVGVEVDGQPCAFVLKALEHPTQHVVNLMINEQPLSVTYCDLADCVRVLSDDRDQPIPLRVGGLDINDEMVLLLHGQRYGQRSAQLPLRDHASMRTSLGNWAKLHPDTLVYAGS